MKLLYLFQPIVEFRKLIWSRDCIEFIFPHSVGEKYIPIGLVNIIVQNIPLLSCIGT
jgi:hypothetical protein